jgi:hypothetical protein
MGRPRIDAAKKKTAAVQLRLSPEERERFDRLVEARQQELRPEGVEVTDAGVLRWLLLREVEARGLDRPKTRKGANR